MHSTATRDFNVAITDVGTGHGLFLLAAHSSCVVSVAFSPDGDRLVTGGGDNTARVRTAFPWGAREANNEEGRAGGDGVDLYRRRHHEALPQAFGSTPLRTNVLDFIGEINLPTQRHLKTQPLLPVPARDPGAGWEQIDLSTLYNAALNETWQPVTGIDLVDLNLAALPTGSYVLGGIPFDVRGLIQLRRPAPDWQWGWQTYPKQVHIPIGHSFRRLHVLHGTGSSEPKGTVIGYYRLSYGDGSERLLEIVYGRDVADWVGPSGIQLSGGEAGRAEVAWTGFDTAQGPAITPRNLRLFRRTYTNPHPEHEVQTIDFVSTLTHCAPFLVAVTVEP
jgi:hypothetical protein